MGERRFLLDKHFRANKMIEMCVCIRGMCVYISLHVHVHVHVCVFMCVYAWMRGTCVYDKGGTFLRWELSNNSYPCEGRGVAWLV